MPVETRQRPAPPTRRALALLAPALALILSACGGASRAGAPPVSPTVSPTGLAGSTPAEAKREPATGAAVSSIDSDADGIPDGAELYTHNDRENFRRWFTRIAEQQFDEPSAEWNEAQRDCAGLVRFSWREALRQHDRRWLARMGASYEAFAPDVRAYTLGRGPLGERLFRTAFGSFRESDLADDTFSEFADARTLKNFNAEFVSRDRARARPGDLVFFHQPRAGRYPFHVMIYLGSSRDDSAGGDDWVVYHTGASPTDKGTVKKLRLAVLDHHPDPHWRPVGQNRNFSGFYRLKILQ